MAKKTTKKVNNNELDGQEFLPPSLRSSRKRASSPAT